LDDVLRTWVPGQLVRVLPAARPGAQEQAAVRGAADDARHAGAGARGGGRAARGRRAQASLHAQGRSAAPHAAVHQHDPGIREMTATLRAALAATVLCGVAWPALDARAADAAAVGHYRLDQAKSSLEFAFEQAGAQNKGKFTRFPVSLDFSPTNL